MRTLPYTILYLLLSNFTQCYVINRLSVKNRFTFTFELRMKWMPRIYSFELDQKIWCVIEDLMLSRGMLVWPYVYSINFEGLWLYGTISQFTWCEFYNFNIRRQGAEHTAQRPLSRVQDLTTEREKGSPLRGMGVMTLWTENNPNRSVEKPAVRVNAIGDYWPSLQLVLMDCSI